nr:MAG TPA: hypothetical protein [Caudoviricetes sp.]
MPVSKLSICRKPLKSFLPKCKNRKDMYYE